MYSLKVEYMTEGRFFHFPFNLFSPGLCGSIGIWMNGLDADFRKGNTTEYNEGSYLYLSLHIYMKLQNIYFRRMSRIEEQEIGVKGL